MINKSINKNEIFFDVEVPNKDIAKCLRADFKKIEEKYRGKPIKTNTLIEMKTDIQHLLNKEKYKNIVVKNNDYYTTDYWDLDKILSEYKKAYPKDFEEKNEYTNIEVNNMLFELSEFKHVIGGYNSPAVPYNMPWHNDKIFEGSVLVEIPILKFD